MEANILALYPCAHQQPTPIGRGGEHTNSFKASSLSFLGAIQASVTEGIVLVDATLSSSATSKAAAAPRVAIKDGIHATMVNARSALGYLIARHVAASRSPNRARLSYL